MIKISGMPKNKTAFYHAKKACSQYRSGIRSALIDIGRKNVRDAKAALREKKSGRVYRMTINGRRFNHRASAPQEAPAYLTGVLYRSYKYIATGSSRLEWGNTAYYANWLEGGTKKMAPRPNIKPVVDKNEGITMKYLQNVPVRYK